LEKCDLEPNPGCRKKQKSTKGLVFCSDGGTIYEALRSWGGLETDNSEPKGGTLGVHPPKGWKGGQLTPDEREKKKSQKLTEACATVYQRGRSETISKASRKSTREAWGKKAAVPPERSKTKELRKETSS